MRSLYLNLEIMLRIEDAALAERMRTGALGANIFKVLRLCQWEEVETTQRYVHTISTLQEISESLYISLQTVKDHVHRIFVKTGVKNRIQLTNMIRSGKL